MPGFIVVIAVHNTFLLPVIAVVGGCLIVVAYCLFGCYVSLRCLTALIVIIVAFLFAKWPCVIFYVASHPTWACLSVTSPNQLQLPAVNDLMRSLALCVLVCLSVCLYASFCVRLHVLFVCVYACLFLFDCLFVVLFACLRVFV